MPKIRNLAIIFLILGVICAELLPNLQSNIASTAYSQADFSLTQSEIITSFLANNSSEQNNDLQLSQNQTTDYITTLNNISYNPNKLVRDILINLSKNQSTTLRPSFISADDNNTLLNPAPISPIPATDQPFIGNVIPPAGTPLSDAYTQGGKAWYQENDKVIVQLPNGITFRSFDKSSGQEIDWLQDRLSYEPLDSPNALDNYIRNYHGQIVAEVQDWALVKFPSGGFIKIAKPQAVLERGPFLTQQ